MGIGTETSTISSKIKFKAKLGGDNSNKKNVTLYYTVETTLLYSTVKFESDPSHTCIITSSLLTVPKMVR